MAAAVSATAQQPSATSSTELRYNIGKLADNVYTNDCLGFSIGLPHGWQIGTVSGAGRNGRAISYGRDLELLEMAQKAALPFGTSALLWAYDGTNLPASPQEYVTSEVQRRMRFERSAQLLRPAFPVEYGGKQFYRSDYSLLINDTRRYIALVYTKFRGYMLGAVLAADSTAELDRAGDSLQSISFQEDRVNAECISLPIRQGVIGSVFSRSAKPTSTAKPSRVRVSSGVSQGLLTKRTEPLYPELARKDKIEGDVVLIAVISENGDVEETNPISGHPLLVPAAIAAVQQWKYKPYLLNGSPVKMETQVKVSFRLVP